MSGAPAEAAGRWRAGRAASHRDVERRGAGV